MLGIGWVLNPMTDVLISKNIWGFAQRHRKAV